VKQGQLLGYVADISNTQIRVAVEQADVALVRSATRGVQVRFYSEPLAPVNADIAREIPAAASRLPSKVLGSAGGGEFRVNPADETGLETAQQLFQFELQLTDAYPPAYFGERVQVRFDHGRETLAKQWFRVGRRLFLSSFGV
ncbi:MAG: peptidase M50, partial [Gammaproteobacteria bacterium]